MQSLSRRAQAIVAALVAVALTAGVTIALVIGEDPGNPGHPRGTVTITLGKPKPGDPTKTTPTKVEVPAAAVRAAGDVGQHEDLKTEDPVGATRDELAQARAQQEDLAQTDDLPIVTPNAAPSQRGCTTRLVQNFSSRRGVRPRLLVAHYTVSSNRPGWDDVWSVVSLFDRPAFQASSNYVIDDEGHCAYIVRESDKAWTQAAANPVAISIEVIATGREGRLSTSAGFAKIGRVFADAAKRWEIPVQRGAVAGCTVTRPGVIDHRALGACGGGHVDVSPYSIDAVLGAVKRAGASSSTSPASSDRRWLTPGERRNVACLEAERRIAKRHGGWSKVASSHLKRAGACKGALRKRRAELERLGLGDHAHRGARYRELGRVVRG